MISDFGKEHYKELITEANPLFNIDDIVDEQGIHNQLFIINLIYIDQRQKEKLFKQKIHKIREKYYIKL